MNTHTAEIANGTYLANIGTTTIKTICNDNAGFAIYAAGYTGNEIGGTNSNKLVGASTNQTIVTGTATSAGNPDVSNWAMKLGTITSPTPTYPIIIAGSSSDTNRAQGDPDFSDYTAVPNEYTKVAYRTAGTDTGTNAEGSTLTTTYAAYISRTQQADAYAGQVIYTLVHPSFADSNGCNPSGTTISTILCMQDITSTNKSSVIASMTQNTQYQLKDNRDGKSYYIAKLADGNVWMTQNLDLDLDSNTTLTPANTDISANWTPSTSTYTSESSWTDSYTTPESYDPGDLYWNGTFDNDFAAWDDYYDNGGDYPLPNFTSNTGDSHYHLGNYYNWTAAVAMNNSSSYTTRNTDVDQSICPAGWMLPKSGTTLTGSGSFYYLVNTLNLTAGTHGVGASGNVQNSPVYLAYGGTWDMGFGDVGAGGHYQSSVVYDDSYTYKLAFSVDGLASQNHFNIRTNGLSVRCVLR